MISTIIKKLFGSSHDREVRRLQPLVARINQLEESWKKKSDADLRGLTADFYRRIDNGEPLDNLIPEAFATVREASRRVVNMRHYDVQLIGGMVLHRGAIAEMKTGEGKTLVATSPLYLNALQRKGAHLITVNDYLATRDAEWMGRIYKFLGMSVGTIVHGQSDQEKQQAYRCDITYGTNNEFGFDYLRDNMKESIERYVQRDLHFAIVDEVDSILIDEARTPLIISGPAEQSAQLYYKVNQIIPRLKKDVDFTVDEKHHSAVLTDSGVEKVEKLLSIHNLYDAQNIEWNHHVQQALRAHSLYKKDVNYMVTDEGKVVIIDEFTGRLMPGRRWSDGLHQAIEAKENVQIEEETQTLATISFQNLFRLYKKLGGMTGTADTEAEEFHKIYKLDVVVIPTNLSMVRKDQPDLVYKNERGKFRAVIEEVAECYERGQPVLVGTVSVEKSEVLAAMLKKRGIPHNVLNAKAHAREAAFVAQAGRSKMVTIATNMAGRGTDILLGGNPEFMARAEVYGEEMACRPGACDESTPEYKEAYQRHKKTTEEDKKKVVGAGGLHILGTERHESRRIDNQLRGRAGRQGDPGSSRFYLSLEDDLLRIFGAERITGLMERLGMEEDVPIEHSMVNRAIENAQRKVEAHHFDMRKHLLEYDDVMNQQRKSIYSLRRSVLEGRLPGFDVEAMLGGKGISAPVKTEGEDGEEHTTVTAQQVDKVKAEYESWHKRLEPVVKVIFEAFWEYPEGQGSDGGEGGVHFGDQPGEISKTDGATERQGGKLRDARALTHELYRRFGSVIEFTAEEQTDKSKAVQKTVHETAVSLVQQRKRVFDLAYDLVEKIVVEYCPEDKTPDDWDIPALQLALKDQFGIAVSLADVNLEVGSLADRGWEQIEKHTEARETELGLAFLYFARHFWLEEIDSQWIDHLKGMDHLREGIGLRGYGQKDPKQEYKKEGYNMFMQMTDTISQNVAKKLFLVRLDQQAAVETPEQEAEQKLPEFKHKARRVVLQHQSSATSGAADEKSTRDTSRDDQPEVEGDQTKQKAPRREEPKVGRNEPCPCGSGKKYKKCHGASAA
ncbi:MAG: preprotein translocase subunit SecA [Deltaproteobacteria bacterium]|jgi:preprotein translocase subunit SecA|nr:preprotein translocase subunit SecA [Deltaproteobacteria bacterium]